MRGTRLGLFVGAFFCIVSQSSSAQVVVPPATEVPIPPKPPTDTTQAKQRTDTLKAPFGRLPSPKTTDIGPQFEWNREEYIYNRTPIEQATDVARAFEYYGGRSVIRMVFERRGFMYTRDFEIRQ